MAIMAAKYPSQIPVGVSSHSLTVSLSVTTSADRGKKREGIHSTVLVAPLPCMVYKCLHFTHHTCLIHQDLSKAGRIRVRT